MLIRDELERYDRQIMIRGIGEEGQESLLITGGAKETGEPLLSQPGC